MRPEDARRIRVIATPEGEAPDWVRDAWVGLELPLSKRGLQTLSLYDDKPPAPTWLETLKLRLFAKPSRRIDAYFVSGPAAIATLPQEAQAWWRDHAAYGLEPNRILLFMPGDCEPLP